MNMNMSQIYLNATCPVFAASCSDKQKGDTAKEITRIWILMLVILKLSLIKLAKVPSGLRNKFQTVEWVKLTFDPLDLNCPRFEFCKLEVYILYTCYLDIVNLF